MSFAIAYRRTVESPGGARISVVDHPATRPSTRGPTLVLAHGWCLSHETWNPVVAELQRRRPRLRVISYDQPGHGHSSRGDSRAVQVSDLGTTLRAVIDATVPSGELVLAGHSMGGMAIMSLAGLAPELVRDRVRGVGFFGTAAQLRRRGIPGERFVMWVLARLPATAGGLPTTPKLTAAHLFGEGPDPEAVLATARMTRTTPANVVADWFSVVTRFDLRATLTPFAEVRTVVVIGSRDRLASISAGRRLTALVPGSTFWSVPGKGHMLTYEATHTVADKLELLLDAEPTSQRARSLAPA